MSAIEMELAFGQAEDALDNAETFERAVLNAALYAADDMPADMRIKLSEIQAWAARDKQKKRHVLREAA